MAKTTKVKNLKSYFFLSLGDGQVNTIYETHGDSAALSAAFAGAMIEDVELFDIIAAAFIAISSDKEKYISKKSNIVHKKPTKKAK
jgi:hypothetical protein